MFYELVSYPVLGILLIICEMGTKLPFLASTFCVSGQLKQNQSLEET